MLTNFKAIVVDVTGTELNKEEQDLFKSEKPAGIILFKRNCVSKKQLRDLVTSIRECIGWAGLPILIDQEGGTVSRLKSPEWTEYPGAKFFGQMTSASKTEGLEAARINSYLMALDLADLDITVNCAPVVDVPAPDCHEFLSASRTYSDSPDTVAQLGEAVCRGLLDGGVTPIIKHIPGHGRAKVDSHVGLPVVDASREDLSTTDFKPFKYLAQTDMKTALWAMAAHVIYSVLDPDSAATVSKRITDEIIRGYMGFEGVLIADDISMNALGGTFESRVAKTMAAGMDLTMLGNGLLFGDNAVASFKDRVNALKVAPKVTEASAKRILKAEEARTAHLKNGNDNKAQLQQKLEALIAKGRTTG